jgi:hypothetical protein
VGTITTIWIKEHEKETWRKFIDIAKREGKSASEMIMDWVKDYVQRHSSNPAMPLDRWVEQPTLTLFPTLGEPPTRQKLMQFPKHQLVEIKLNAEAYYSLSEDLLRWMDKHERYHVKLNYKDEYCPYCRE